MPSSVHSFPLSNFILRINGGPTYGTGPHLLEWQGASLMGYRFAELSFAVFINDNYYIDLMRKAVFSLTRMYGT